MAFFFLVCISSLLLIILFSSYAYQIFQATRRRLPPGPMPLPVIGNLLDVASRLPHRSLSRLAGRYGALMAVRLGTAVVVVASSPAAAREVLGTHNAAITGRAAPDAWNAMAHVADSVFILPPRRRWRALRRVGAEHLLSPRRLDGAGGLLRPAMRAAAAVEMRRRIASAAAAAPAVEVGRVAFDAMADTAWRAMFSSGLDAAALRELHGVAREAALLALKPNVSDFFPALAALDLQGVRRSMARQLGKVYKLIDQEIDQRRRGREEAGVGDDEHKADLLEVLLDMSEQEKVDDDGRVVMNRDAIRAFLTDLFLAAMKKNTELAEMSPPLSQAADTPDTPERVGFERARPATIGAHGRRHSAPFLVSPVKSPVGFAGKDCGSRFWALQGEQDSDGEDSDDEGR